MALAPGTQLGHYEIEASLGRGGMGEVYRARDRKLGRAVAVKVLSSAFASDPERLRRFEQEALAASALNHPNIVHVYDIDRIEPATHYIVMELVTGKTLREVLAKAPLPRERLSKLGRQIAAGLAKAHGAGIVHRDLKPENVMVTEDGFVKILDFGLAKLVSLPFEPHSEMATLAREATRHGTLIGTVEYMSPEQAAGRSVDARSDQFSLGLILYEMATGELAFQRETAAQTLASIIESEPRSISELNAKAPPGLEAVVRRCLRKRPEDRYEDTRELVRDLEALERGDTGEPRPTSRAPRGITIAIGKNVESELRAALEEVERDLRDDRDDRDDGDQDAEVVYHVRSGDGRERSLSEARLRRNLLRHRYSGVEMVRREGEDRWVPIRETPLFGDALERRERSQRRKAFELGKHGVVFVSVGAAFTIATGDVPTWLAFWGIGLAAHAFSTLPAIASLWRRRSLPAVPDAAEAPPPRELLSGSFREEIERVRELLKRRSGDDVEELLKEVDAVVARITEAATLRRDLEEQTSKVERDRLARAEAEARARLEKASSVQDRELHQRHLDVLAGRRRAIDKALAVIERLGVRQEMAEHQLKQLRPDLSRGEASSASAPELSSRLQDIRHEVDAIEQVDEAIAKELLS